MVEVRGVQEAGRVVLGVGLVVRVVSPVVIQKSKPSNKLGFLWNRRAEGNN